MYSKTVIDHFKHPRNVGIIEDADGVGEIGNPLCGYMTTIYLKVVYEHIKDIKFQTLGCGAAIAVSSMLTELAKGKGIEEAMKITNQDVANALEGLPKNKLHCSNLGDNALKTAIKDYQDRKAGRSKSELRRKEPHEHDSSGMCYCPYCNSEIYEVETTCKSCALSVED